MSKEQQKEILALICRRLNTLADFKLFFYSDFFYASKYYILLYCLYNSYIIVQHFKTLLMHFFTII